MADSAINVILYKNLQEGVGTDCTFVFKSVNSDDGSESTKEIRAHRCVLSGVSPYFETNFKSTWKGDQPIEVTTVEFSVFENVLRAIYLCDIQPTTSLKGALALYEAAHFYQLDAVIELTRNEIIRFCSSKPPRENSQLVISILKHQDYRLIEFFRNFFIKYGTKIIAGPDFVNYPLEAVNMLYQIEDLSITEILLLNGLEKYVDKIGSTSIPLIKPAIRAIRFGSLPSDRIKSTNLLSEDEKNIIQKQGTSPFSYLSKGIKGRGQSQFSFGGI